MRAHWAPTSSSTPAQATSPFVSKAPAANLCSKVPVPFRWPTSTLICSETKPAKLFTTAATSSPTPDAWSPRARVSVLKITASPPLRSILNSTDSPRASLLVAPSSLSQTTGVIILSRCRKALTSRLILTSPKPSAKKKNSPVRSRSGSSTICEKVTAVASSSLSVVEQTRPLVRFWLRLLFNWPNKNSEPKFFKKDSSTWERKRRPRHARSSRLHLSRK